MHTKDEVIQAFVGQVFIDQYFLLLLRAASQEPNQIHVLKFGYELNFIFELHQTLSGMWIKSLYCNFSSIGKVALGKKLDVSIMPQSSCFMMHKLLHTSST